MEFWRNARAALDGLPNGAGLNIAHEAVARHVMRGRADQAAFRFIGRGDEVTSLTYGELERLSNRFANALTTLGVVEGDRVFAVAGRIPELYTAALATLKVKAIFSALFETFGPEPVRRRLDKAKARVVITTDSFYRRHLAEITAELPSLEHVIVIGEAISGTRSFAQLMIAASDHFVIPPTDPGDPAILHFTSGTSGSPKGAIHTHEAVIAYHATARLALGLSPGDIYWCTADPGWVAGISYGLIAPLVGGVTSIVDASAFDAGRWYRIIQQQQVARWYTSPTSLRMLMKAGTALARTYDLSCLRLIASAGEPLNPELIRWGRKALGHDIHDTWWQTETGSIVIATCPEEVAVPGAIGRLLPGFQALLVERGHEGGAPGLVPAAGQEGELAIASGWPSMFRGYWGEPELYSKCFRGGHYLSGDLMRCDAEGRFWFVSRADEMIKSAGHLIGPFEVESVLIEHPAVAEAGVVGKPDPLIGEAVKAYISLRPGHLATDALAREILAFARLRLGAALAPREIAFAFELPKTRSGKILRRVLKAKESGVAEPALLAQDAAEGGDYP